MKNIRNFMDPNRYNHQNADMPKSPHRISSFEFFSTEKSDQPNFARSNVTEQLPRSHKNPEYQFLRQTYNVSSSNTISKDLKPHNQQSKSSKFLRSTINGNVDEIMPRKQQLTASYAGGYAGNSVSQGFIKNYDNKPSPLRPGYKIDEYLSESKKLRDYAQTESHSKNVEMLDQIQRLKYQRKLRQESSRNIQEVRSVQMKKKSQSPEKDEKKFIKKNYYEYYTPKFDKSMQEDKFHQKQNLTSERNRSRSKTPVKVQKYPYSTMHKNSRSSYDIEANTYKNAAEKYSSPVLTKSGVRSPHETASYSIQSQKRLSRKYNFGEERVRRLSIRDFTLGKVLGEGKFGTVHQALHKQTKSLYAIKKIPKQMIKTHLLIDQFLKEVKLQSFMNHKNVLAIFGICDDSEHIYLILEYMEEGTLFKVLKTRKVVPEQEAAIYIKQVAQAIRYIHEIGVAHRDIKPENIVMSYGNCKLCDFGWATVCTERRKTYCGTFDYAAPQILQGTQYDMSVDLWCLGVLAYQLMVGKAPFYHISRKQTMKRILNVDQFNIIYPQTLSKNAVSFIESLIKKNPDERLRSDSLLSHPFLRGVDREFF